MGIASRMATLGVDLMNCIAMVPVAGTPYAGMQEMAQTELDTLRDQAGQYLPQMRHCTRCRADAMGMLGADRSSELAALME